MENHPLGNYRRRRDDGGDEISDKEKDEDYAAGSYFSTVAPLYSKEALLKIIRRTRELRKEYGLPEPESTCITRHLSGVEVDIDVGRDVRMTFNGVRMIRPGVRPLKDHKKGVLNMPSAGGSTTSSFNEEQQCDKGIGSVPPTIGPATSLLVLLIHYHFHNKPSFLTRHSETTLRGVMNLTEKCNQGLQSGRK